MDLGNKLLKKTSLEPPGDLAAMGTHMSFLIGKITRGSGNIPKTEVSETRRWDNFSRLTGARNLNIAEITPVFLEVSDCRVFIVGFIKAYAMCLSDGVVQQRRPERLLIKPVGLRS